MMGTSKRTEAKEPYHIQLKSRYWKTTSKFRIQAVKSVDKAYKLDLETGTDSFWTKAIRQKMAKVKVSFSCWDGGMLEKALNGKNRTTILDEIPKQRYAL